MTTYLLSFLLSAVLPACADSVGVVNLSAVYMRSAPDYESSLETQELMGVEVKIAAEKEYWLQVESPQPYTAWTTFGGITVMSGEELKLYRKAPKFIVASLYGAVLEAPHAGAAQVCDLVAGDILRMGEAASEGGFVAVALPDGTPGWVDADSVVPLCEWESRCRSMNMDARRKAAVSFALKMKGVPYLWGGMTPKGLDCSGLTRLCYLMQDISLPRNASEQVAACIEIPIFPKPDGDSDFSALIPGDLVYFGRVDENGRKRVSHIGIYVGDGRMVHSSHKVRVNSLRRGDADCYENVHKLLGACRIAE